MCWLMAFRFLVVCIALSPSAEALLTPTDTRTLLPTCNDYFLDQPSTFPVPKHRFSSKALYCTCTGTVQGTVVPAFKCAWAQSVAARVGRKKISEKTHGGDWGP
ncbi:hypothetical protein FCM35_KLT14740 [Carex littledalei]|uniref:Secreted protein n=1 Tax=Carex littledalei TaxID=544730 RepID=A0A833QHS3_9POAL|nr:hypothetical protein FCM35_KLT14740 [Carex littledalei]